MPSYLLKAQNRETIAAIDLGSNAMRATIAQKIPGGLEVLKNVRMPLRLGEDVFATGNISSEKILNSNELPIRIIFICKNYIQSTNY